MTSTRTIEAAGPGPVGVVIRVPSATIRITAASDITTAYATVTADDEAQASRFRLAADGRRLSIGFDTQGAGTTTFIPGDRQNRAVLGGYADGKGGIVNTGISIAGGGNISMSGIAIGQGATVLQVAAGAHHIVQGELDDSSTGALLIDVRVPTGSNIDITSLDGSITTSGVLETMTVSTDFASVDIDTAASLSVESVHGHVSVANATRTARLKTTHGDIRVFGTDEATASCSSSAGNITFGRNLNITGRTRTGHFRSAMP